SATPKKPPTWSEKIWLARLETAVGAERRIASPVAAVLPTMLVALGWVGTARSLAALLPPSDVPVTLDHLELLLPAIGYRTQRVRATGSRSDSDRLRAGSLAQTSGGDVAVYLGQPDGKDLWLVNGNRSFALSAGDTILTVDPDIDFHSID